MIDVDKMNDVLSVGFKNPVAQEVIDNYFDKMAEFTNNHSSERFAKFGTISRGEILGLFMDDLYEDVINHH